VSYDFSDLEFGRTGLTCFKIEMFENGILQMDSRTPNFPSECATLFDSEDVVTISRYGTSSGSVASFNSDAGYSGQFAVKEDPSVVTGPELRFVNIGESTFLAELLFPSCSAPSASPTEAPLPEVDYLTLGYFHTCTLDDRNILLCWGRNTDGELGIGSEDAKVPKPTIVTFDSGSVATLIASGGFHSCAVDNLKVFRCWGQNFYGQLGDATYGSSTLPVVVSLGPDFSDVLQVVCSSTFTCAVDVLGKLKCWGSNKDGKLALDTEETRINEPTEVSIGLTSFVIQVSLGLDHSCAIDDENVVKCWGSNKQGQLGIVGPVTTPVPTVVTSDTGEPLTARKISLGGQHSCAIDLLNSLKCWGLNIFGQVGDGTTQSRSTPTSIFNSEVKTVSLGYYHSCAIDNLDVLRCWGNNDSGELGDGSTDDKLVPTEINVNGSSSDYAVLIGLGAFHTCAYDSGGTVRCWGDNSFGQLGDNTQDERTTATAIVTD